MNVSFISKKCLLGLFVLAGVLILQISGFTVTKFGGFTETMNPYNPLQMNQGTKIQFILKDSGPKDLGQENIYPFFFPYSIRGSFKYFYYRYPSIEKSVAEKFCEYVSREHEVKAILVSYSLAGKAQIKNYKCN